MASDGQKPKLNVRFPPSLAAAARNLAEQSGMSLSAWVRRQVEREVSRREGVCVTCGQPVPPDTVPCLCAEGGTRNCPAHQNSEEIPHGQ